MQEPEGEGEDYLYYSDPSQDLSFKVYDAVPDSF